jgi:hypothetical protein
MKFHNRKRLFLNFSWGLAVGWIMTDSAKLFNRDFAFFAWSKEEIHRIASDEKFTFLPLFKMIRLNGFISYDNESKRLW